MLIVIYIYKLQYAPIDVGTYVFTVFVKMKLLLISVSKINSYYYYAI